MINLGGILSYIIEKEFNYNGYECLIILRNTGVRCGYVGVNPGHELYGKPREDLIHFDTELSMCVHGGITFAGKLEEIVQPDKSQVWWFGFDYAHMPDELDYEAAIHAFPDMEDYYALISNLVHGSNLNKTKYTIDYAVSDCKSLTQQISKYERVVLDTLQLNITV